MYMNSTQGSNFLLWCLSPFIIIQYLNDKYSKDLSFLHMNHQHVLAHNFMHVVNMLSLIFPPLKSFEIFQNELLPEMWLQITCNSIHNLKQHVGRNKELWSETAHVR